MHDHSLLINAHSRSNDDKMTTMHLHTVM